jgi:nucleoside-diphosphate-sugar epimerase
MRVFVTGATGALGRHLVPALVAEGHEVTATTRTPAKAAGLRAAGAAPVILDGLDRNAVIAGVLAASPDVIVHEMTALASMRNLRQPDKVFATTNALRTQGTDNLLAAAAQAGTRRVIAQSYVSANARTGNLVKTEDDPIDTDPVPTARQTLAAIRHVEETVPRVAPEGIVLRYGSFYGPGASDILLDTVRKRQWPVIGGGTGIWSFIEITDAAAATLAAVSHGAPGVYNVADSDPAPSSEWLPYLAGLLGAKPPLRVPAWLGRLLAGEFIVAQMTSARGSSNEKARKELGWGAALPELAGGVPCLGQGMTLARPATGRCCSPSPTG